VYLDEGIPYVSAAHASGAKQATAHLLSLGHRRIAAITGPAGWMATEERRYGYHAAFAAAG
jgi:LacI family transcriptional regulator